MKINLEEWDKKVCVMMAGKMTESPFSDDEKKAAREFMQKWCKEKGFPAVAGPNDVYHANTYPDLRLLQAFLRVCKDPDAPALDAYCEGVRLGHNMQMPRTPAVF